MTPTISSTSDDSLREKSAYVRWKQSCVSQTLAPLTLMLLCPSLLLLLWHSNLQWGGSLTPLWSWDTPSLLSRLWIRHGLGSATAWTWIFSFMGLQLVLMRLLPGELVEGAASPSGYTPKYRNNGLLCFLTTLLLYGLVVYGLGLISPLLVYEEFGSFLGALNILALGLCVFLYLKALTSGERPTRHSSRVFQFYWGSELHPRLLGWDIKQFTNCRFGMSSWFLLNCCFAYEQWELYGFLSDSMLVCVGLQALYILKFYVWEAGYLRSLDIMHDRAGFYICWGCLVWVPGFYTLPAQYLITHPVSLGLPLSLLLFGVGMACIGVNYDADRQRKLARDTDGHCTIWGRPARCLEVFYENQAGESQKSLLLLSGWWGVARHFHYLPELGAALCWSLPALFHHLTPYLYVLFLAVLLLERAHRDDLRCRTKYGSHWDLYCEQVKFLIIPGLW